jgi:AraC-like DNA-binding protein
MAPPTLVFGWRTAVLTLVSVQVVVIVMGLLGATRNRLANRLLVALLMVVVGLITPFTLGFAGFYDAFPWLSFAPFAIPLAVGPLVYGYVTALITGAAPKRLGWHLAPALVQFAYLSVCFTLPLRAKNAWDHLTTGVVDPLVSTAAILGLAIYTLFSMRLLAVYRRQLGEVVADEGRYAARWLRNALTAVLIVLAVETGYQAWEFAVAPLNYFGVFGLYLAFCGLALYLGIEGWRHAELNFPRLSAPLDTGAAIPAAHDKDWRGLAERWTARAEAEGWHRDPDLTLAGVAARLGINTHYLSRGLNQGLGMNFASVINQMRCRAVAVALDRGRPEDLLTLALEAGFNSKASFNRAFMATFGESPSAYRRRLDASKSKESPSDTKSRRVRG